MTNYFRTIWLGIYTVLVGMGVTLKHLFAKKVTNQYPDRWHPIEDKFDGKRSKYAGDPDHAHIVPENSRNRIFVDMGICNGCRGCERACPVDCITVETVKVTPGDDVPPLADGGKRGLWVTNFQIDFAKCCFCALCTEPCPTNAIRMTQDFEYAGDDRQELIYTFSTMTEEEAKEKEQLYAEYQKEKKKKAAAKKAAEAKKKKEEGGGEEDDKKAAAKKAAAKKAAEKKAAEKSGDDDSGDGNGDDDKE